MFCTASGQRVSLEKSKIFFSNNVSRELEKEISNESGIKSTKDLGKYLGMHILQRRINKTTFGEVVEKILARLAGWKGRFLSAAGRLTLTKAVLSSIPVHSMSTILLPKTTLEKLDQISRNFIWGSTTEERKQHLISWDRVCQPNMEGGLGIRRAEEMNKALLGKVGWRLLHDQKSLWAKILLKKYKVGSVHDHSWTVGRGTWSSTWRSIATGLREVVLPGLSWVLGDGTTTQFWTDKWLGQSPLIELVQGCLPPNHRVLCARDLWKVGTGWDFAQLMPYITDSTKLSLLAIVLDTITGSKDRLSWGMNADGRFTVKSAYDFLTRSSLPKPSMKKFYGRVWKVIAPERVRLFLWLVGNQVIMTNMERQRRHLSDTGICPVCKSGDETIIHVLRDCPAMSGIWTRLVEPRKVQAFFAKSLLEWLYDNLDSGGEVDGGTWPTLFAMAIWWGWKWRCGNVFGENGKCRDRVRFVKDLAQEVTLANSSQGITTVGTRRVERLIKWLPPSVGWLKVNTDGASRGNPGLASAGGVLRDDEGNWCGGFAVNIGLCSAPLAELCGVYYGLFMAWERRATRVELEVDSEMVVGFLKTGIGESHPVSFLVRLCYGFISKDWIVRVTHVYREANRLADGLANHAFSLSLGFHRFDHCPDIVSPLMYEDLIGVAHPRQVRV